MPLTVERRKELILELASRPGHEKVRTLVTELLIHELGATSTDIHFEQPIPEVSGRLDALLGRTVFEFKKDLRYERPAAEEQLNRYLGQRERETSMHFVGIATDGALFQPYELRNDALAALKPFQVKDNIAELIAWLDSAVAIQADLPPDPDTVKRELGRQSLTYDVARHRLAALWLTVAEHPEVTLKRQLWADLLERVYGSPIGSDELFFQHTYLTIVAKTMATRVLGAELPPADELLAGKPFQDAGIDGAVESDFFDWVLVAEGSSDLIDRIARQVARFRLAEVQSDVLKGLYESLIDPEQRHDLGEYYTPDWLAARMCQRVIDAPLEQRVLDPACGSGTFLFHASRRYLEAADSAGLSPRDALLGCTRSVLGIDVHPVAVLIARVTYLLAIGEDRLRDHPEFSVPVYLGDSLQWNTEGFMAEREVLIAVPGGPTLHFPASVASDPARFDAIVSAMVELSEQGAGAEAMRAWLEREHPLDDSDSNTVTATYEVLRRLHSEGRDHIWGYVCRNLSRPVWLSSAEERADVVIGNPPWLSFRFMSRNMQESFRRECQNRNIWGGGNVATQQDLSAYFFARCVELYLKLAGKIAFVMPYAALNRKQFAGFRIGYFGARRAQSRNPFAVVRFREAWTMDEDVQPLFPVPSCVLIAEAAEPGALPTTVDAAFGQLNRRDASPPEADRYLRWEIRPWPAEVEFKGGSPYRASFRNGATMFPRVLCIVQRVDIGMLGGNPQAPLVQSRQRSQEKRPWSSLPRIRHNVEARFLRPLYMGESIAPYRLLEPVLSVLPYEEGLGMLDAASARLRGHRHLAAWLAEAELLWNSNGSGRLSLAEQVNYLNKVTAQFPLPPIRVLYSKAGTQPAATILRDREAIIDHKLYWAPTGEAEAYYLCAILNSETARQRVGHLQSRGQWGARDFDKLMFGLPIPSFEAANGLHTQLSAAGRDAEALAAHAQLREGIHFVTARREIRKALAEDGIGGRIERLVEALLGPE